MKAIVPRKLWKLIFLPQNLIQRLRNFVFTLNSNWALIWHCFKLVITAKNRKRQLCQYTLFIVWIGSRWFCVKRSTKLNTVKLYTADCKYKVWEMSPPPPLYRKNPQSLIRHFSNIEVAALIKYTVFEPGMPGWGVKACQNGLEHISPRFPGRVRACQDGLEHFFPHLPVWQRGGGPTAIWARPIKKQHISKRVVINGYG